MVAVEAYPAFKLFNLSKSKTFDGLGDEKVFISKRTKGHESVERVYEKICLEYNQGKPMIWGELYKILYPEVRRKRWYLNKRNS